MGMEQQIEAAARFLKGGTRFVVAAHRGPDGDAMGSLLALSAILEDLGKEVLRYCKDAVPYPFLFLDGVDRVRNDLPTQDAQGWCAVLLDCSEPRRASSAFERFVKGRPLLVVDHHLSGKAKAHVVVNDPGAAAVGLMVEWLIAPLGARLSPGVAEAIYTAVISDTGSFHYSNTSSKAMCCCGRMLDAGVDPWRVATHLYEADPVERVRLLGEVLNTLELSSEGDCASLLVTLEMMQRCQASEDLLDGFINYGRRVQGVEIAVLFRELRGGGYKASMRSRGRVNVAAIAVRFGGGGHHNAAGCRLKGDFATIRRRIFEAVREELSRCLGPQVVP